MFAYLGTAGYYFPRLHDCGPFMRFSLTNLFGYLSFACVAMALTQLNPVIGFCLFLVTLFVLGMILSAENWEHFFSCVILTMSVYCLSCVLLIDFAWPDPFPGTRALNSDREAWRDKHFGIVQSTMIPIACLIGSAIWGIWQTRLGGAEERSGNWYVREAMLIVVAGCSVLLFFLFYPAIGLEKTLRHGNQIMFIWQHQEPFDYPANADRWIAMEWREKYLSVSVPLLVASATVSIGFIFWALKFVRPKLLSRLKIH